MSKKESIARYSLIINKLRKKPSTFAEIDSYLAIESEIQGYNFILSKRTFQRAVEEIFSLYQIEIKYDFSRKVYYIATDDEPKAIDRMLEAFDTLNALNISERVRRYIHFENRRPLGTENLYGLLHAIENKFRLEFNHQKLWDSGFTIRIVEPYALKEFRSRWYLIAKDCKDHVIKSFALERIQNLQITRQKFQTPPDFSVEEMYKYCFGIVSSNGEKPCDIVLSFDPYQGKYIKGLPLHHTQEILVDNQAEFRIRLHLCITHDFVMELLSFGDAVKVIMPKKLVEVMKTNLERAVNQYLPSL